MSDAPVLPAPVRLRVRHATGEYPIEIACDLPPRLPALLDAAGLPARRVMVSSPHVWRFHGHSFEGVASEPAVLVPDGEKFKTLGTAGRVYDALIRMHADRATALVAVGGGVIGDVAGFVAATYLRGIPLVQVPTTLLAQVDSGVGGKVGVNHALGKNLIGAFHQPALVAIDPLFPSTLPRREFRAGLYEVVKYGVIASRGLFDRIAAGLPALFDRQPAALVPVIAESCRIKASIVEEDERESGSRRVLNFGHTVGHALEGVTRYRRFRHGEAVAYGMLVAAQVAVARGAMPGADRDALAALVTQLGPLPPVADLPLDQVLEAVRRDKKVVAGRLHFVLPTTLGAATIVDDVTLEELGSALGTLGIA